MSRAKFRWSVNDGKIILQQMGGFGSTRLCDVWYFICEKDEIASTEVTAQPELAPWIDRFALVPIIREWKHRWMKQEPRYSHIAYGIDANMVHDLADKLSDWLRAEGVKRGIIKE